MGFFFKRYLGLLMKDIYFERVCCYFSEKKEWYSKRFSYSACELWLCVEACNILNFDHEKAFCLEEERKYCFNEDAKRDLTIYNTFTDEVISHIEVKLLYPSYSLSKSNKKIQEVFDKFKNNKANDECNLSGWFFLIWSSLNTGSYITSEKFFSDKMNQIKLMAEKDECFSFNENNLTHVLEDVFKWKEGTKEIIVKAIYVENSVY